MTPNSHGREENGKFKFSLPNFLWGLVLITLQTLLTVMGISIDYNNKQAGEPIRMFPGVTSLVTVLSLASLNLVSVVVFVSCARNHRSFNNILDILERVDQKLQLNLPAVNSKAKVALVFIFTAILIMCDGVLDYRRSLRLRYKDNVNSVCYIPAQSMFFAQASLFLHFTQVTQSIAKRFRIANSRIKQEVMRNIRERLIRKQCLPRANVPQSDRDVSSTREVESLMSAYWLLCDVVHQANVFYGCQIFAILFNSPSTSVVELADETAPMICKLINTDLDPTLENCLKEFLLQLRNHKPKVSSKGFFHVHNSCLMGMTGAVTTYMVILLQLQFPPHKN
ncbi:gustatory receptor [Homalodisca vitripennis]|nr:gustatory receptor [Homalodisca vitripennis]